MTIVTRTYDEEEYTYETLEDGTCRVTDPSGETREYSTRQELLKGEEEECYLPEKRIGEEFPYFRYHIVTVEDPMDGGRFVSDLQIKKDGKRYVYSLIAEQNDLEKMLKELDIASLPQEVQDAIQNVQWLEREEK